MRASYSKVSTFYFCPKKYEYRYVLDTPAPEKPELAFGVAMHAALEANFAQKIDSRRDLPLRDVLDFFRRDLDQRLRRVPDDNLRGSTDTHYLRSMGEDLLTRFMAARAPALQPAPHGVECAFRLPVPGGHEIVGKFDLMDKDWVLHDFKTSNKFYNPRTVDKTQLVIYAWACERIFGRTPEALCFDVFVKGDGADGVVELQEPVLFPTPSPAEMARVAAGLQKQIERILRTQSGGAFNRSFSPLRCHWCEYQPPCLRDWEDQGQPAPVRVSMDSLV